jgi:hypothetical protein
VARVDVSILKEIARIVQSRAKVPERIQVQKRTFLITYLDDHKQRIEEALRRHDPDRLNMLFGQLESKVKYQVVRKAAGAAAKHEASRLSRAASRSRTKGSQKRTGKPARETGKKKPTVKARQKLPKSKAKRSPRKRSNASKGGRSRA